MASLSTQISNLSPTQTANLKGKMGPILEPLKKVGMGWIVDSVLGASTSGMAAALKPVEGYLPSEVKTAIQLAINAVLGPSTLAPKTVSPYAHLTTRPTLDPSLQVQGGKLSLPTGGSQVQIPSGTKMTPGYTPTPVPFEPEPWYTSTPAKIGLAVGGVFVGFKLLKKMKKK